ncbi:hypothetical protein LTR08_004619 [Meristemomyces frigidus]|nr:hypothetical protein LTR08_004619 [Meristemomyces frigidus]
MISVQVVWYVVKPVVPLWIVVVGAGDEELPLDSLLLDDAVPVTGLTGKDVLIVASLEEEPPYEGGAGTDDDTELEVDPETLFDAVDPEVVEPLTGLTGELEPDPYVVGCGPEDEDDSRLLELP